MGFMFHASLLALVLGLIVMIGVWYIKIKQMGKGYKK